jgi:hypothetical protein
MSVQMMQLVGRAGDRDAWTRDNAERYPGGPRHVAAARFAAAAARVREAASTSPAPPKGAAGPD